MFIRLLTGYDLRVIDCGQKRLRYMLLNFIISFPDVGRIDRELIDQVIDLDIDLNIFSAAAVGFQPFVFWWIWRRRGGFSPFQAL
jgi:hypothetical protein